jgi:hypothetical protein
VTVEIEGQLPMICDVAYHDPDDTEESALGMPGFGGADGSVRETTVERALNRSDTEFRFITGLGKLAVFPRRAPRTQRRRVGVPGGVIAAIR